MKKTKQLLIALMLTVTTFTSFAQTSTKTLSKGKFGTVKTEHYKKYSESDTSTYLYISFRNMKYTHIIDMGGILISSQKDLNKLIEEINDCIKHTSNKSDNIDYNRVKVYDFSRSIYFFDGNKRTIITPNVAKKMVVWLKNLNFRSNN